MSSEKNNLTSSVIILNYNNASFLEESIQSVLHQTEQADEIIICDDASSDNSLLILEKYQENIKVLKSNDNKGPLHNCLSGIRESNSDILFFLDSDDKWGNKKIEIIKTIFEENDKISICSHRHKHINGEGNPLPIYDETHKNMDRIKAKNYGFYNESSDYKKSILFRKGGYWLGSAYSFRRKYFNLEEFEKIIRDCPSSRNAYGDLTIAPYIVAKNPKCYVAYKDTTLFYYRRHLNNATPSLADARQKVSSIKRISQTNVLTAHILNSISMQASAKKDILSRYELLMREYEYLIDIYSNRKLSALIKFISLFPFFIIEGKSLKESLRLLSIILLGRNKSLYLLHRRHLKIIKNSQLER